MGALDFLKRKQTVQIIERGDSYDSERVGNMVLPDKLTDATALRLANTVAEVYNPVDFLADRASKLRFYIANKQGVEIPESSELNRFINRINPLYSFSDLMYQAVFSYLVDGNLSHYVNVPQSYRTVSVNNISRLDVLNPELLSLREYSNISELTATSVRDFIKEARYYSAGTASRYDQLRVDRLMLYRIDWTRRDLSGILCKSPLYKAEKSINNLLATYSARYNVYANNGAAGWLVKKTAGNSIENSIANRSTIVDDLSNKYGVSGNRRLWGISSVPLEWINTMSTIKDLLPFEETLEDSIKIASVFGIPAQLVSRKDNSTFDNQAEAERSVWENTLMSLVDTMLSYFTRSFTLDAAGYNIKADYATVSVLNENKIEKEAYITARLQNLKALKELSPEQNIDNSITKIMSEYESE